MNLDRERHALSRESGRCSHAHVRPVMFRNADRPRARCIILTMLDCCGAVALARSHLRGRTFPPTGALRTAGPRKPRLASAQRRPPQRFMTTETKCQGEVPRGSA